jgi:hypothetical protein
MVDYRVWEDMIDLVVIEVAITASIDWKIIDGRSDYLFPFLALVVPINMSN